MSESQTGAGNLKSLKTGWLRVGNLDRIRHDQGWLAEGGLSVTNLGNLDRIRHDEPWLAEGEFSVTNLGNLDRIRHDQG